MTNTREQNLSHSQWSGEVEDSIIIDTLEAAIHHPDALWMEEGDIFSLVRTADEMGQENCEPLRQYYLDTRYSQVLRTGTETLTRFPVLITRTQIRGMIRAAMVQKAEHFSLPAPKREPADSPAASEAAIGAISS